VDLWYQDKTVLKETIRAHFTTPSSAKNTKATNVPKGFVTVGQVASFVIQARNQNDLNSTTGGDEFEVYLISAFSYCVTVALQACIFIL